MTASLGVLRRAFTLTGVARAQPDPVEQPRVESVISTASPPDSLAEQQIRGLVRSLFLPGWPRPAHQVVFSAADVVSDGAFICSRAAELLARENGVKVCLVEANLKQPSMEQSFGGTSSDGREVGQVAGAMRKSSRQLHDNLWLVTHDVFFGSPERAANLPWLRSRLGELRREFDYSLIHGPLAAEPGGGAAIAHLVDGLVLTIDAGRTRRVTAQRVREQLVACNVRLLGAVLLDRAFPIPERLYRRI
jgi:Mrp family chromosome partitioning ATPase